MSFSTRAGEARPNRKCKTPRGYERAAVWLPMKRLAPLVGCRYTASTLRYFSRAPPSDSMLRRLRSFCASSSQSCGAKRPSRTGSRKKGGDCCIWCARLDARRGAASFNSSTPLELRPRRRSHGPRRPAAWRAPFARTSRAACCPASSFWGGGCPVCGCGVLLCEFGRRRPLLSIDKASFCVASR